MKNGIYPSKKTLLLFIIPLIILIFSIFIYWLSWLPIIGLNILFVLFILFDGFISPDYKKKVEITISIIDHFKINSYNNFLIKIHNKNKIGTKFYLMLDLDYSFDRLYSKKILKVRPLQKKEIKLKIFAKRRGEFESKQFFIKGKSIFGLLFFYRCFKHSINFKVAPYIKNINQNFKIIQKKIKKIEGFQKNYLIGDGSDFEMLRDYIKGDEFNKIDWHATSRLKKPITKVYRLENKLEIAIMIDCGRLMATEVNGMSLLDYAVNSALILSYSAIQGYDKVSLTCFGNDIIKYIPPIKSNKDIKKLDYVLTDIKHQNIESNYQTAFGFIKQKLFKRSIIIILTDIIDDSNVKIYHKYLSLLKKKHIILLVLIRDKNLFKVGKSLLSNRLTLFTKTAAADLILRRNKTIHDLKKLGIDILDLYPEQINAKIISKYVEIKSRN